MKEYYLKCAECGRIIEYDKALDEWYFYYSIPYCVECVEKERKENE